RPVWLVAAVVAISSLALAERLPVKIYTTADGLAQNVVNRIVRDSRGFLWFCTNDGLSRYDGYTFTNYSVEQGLPDSEVRDLLERGAGEYWVGTYSGLCRFNPRGRPSSALRRQLPTDQNNTQRTTDDPMFVFYRPNDHPSIGSVNALLEDRTGIVWCGT